MRREERVWRGVQISNDRDGDESGSAAQYDEGNVVDGNVLVDFAQILAELGVCEKEVSRAASGKERSIPAIEESLAKISALLPIQPHTQASLLV
jgi:hypothetical protein